MQRQMRLKIKIFDAGPLFVYSITILLIRILLAALPQFLDHQLTYTGHHITWPQLL
ncbi:MAG: hypothetical protein R6V15_01735 [Desulfotignum sp.]